MLIVVVGVHQTQQVYWKYNIKGYYEKMCIKYVNIIKDC